MTMLSVYVTWIVTYVINNKISFTSCSPVIVYKNQWTGTVPLKRSLACSHESICSWLNNHQLKGRGTHFVREYCWITCKDGYSQVKWVPCPFSWWLFNHKQIDSCGRVRRCAWAVRTVIRMYKMIDKKSLREVSLFSGLPFDIISIYRLYSFDHN